MADKTHIFSFRSLDDSYISGEAQLDSNDLDFVINDFSKPLPLGTLSDFEKLMQLVKEIYEGKSGIKEIIIKSKE